MSRNYYDEAGNIVLSDQEPEDVLQKFHAMIFNEYDSISGNDINGILYTSGFDKGNEGYFVTNTSRGTTKLEVSRSIRLSMMNTSIAEDISINNDEFIRGEFIYENYIYVVFFKQVWHDENIVLPPHELLSIS